MRTIFHEVASASAPSSFELSVAGFADRDFLGVFDVADLDRRRRDFYVPARFRAGPEPNLARNGSTTILPAFLVSSPPKTIRLFAGATDLERHGGGERDWHFGCFEAEFWPPVQPTSVIAMLAGVFDHFSMHHAVDGWFSARRDFRGGVDAAFFRLVAA